MASDYNILADYIVTKFIDRVSGTDLDTTFVEEDPSKRVMVGLLAEDRVEQSFEGGYTENTGTKFDSIPSISLSFLVKKKQGAVLRLMPTGLLFYTVRPDYQKTVSYMLEKYSEKDKRIYKDIKELSDINDRFRMPLTYRKVDISSVMEDGIEVRLDDLQPSTFHLQNRLSGMLKPLTDKVSKDIRIVNAGQINFVDLASEERFNQIVTVKGEEIVPRWDIDIVVTVKDEGENLRFLLQMVNLTKVNATKNIGYLPKIFDAGLRVSGNDAVEFQNLPLDYFGSSYKERTPIYAVSENTYIEFQPETNELVTNNVPKYYQKRLVTKDDLAEFADFEKLIKDPLGNLKEILKRMQADYERCEEQFLTATGLSKLAKQKYRNALADYKAEIARFAKGISQIEYKDYVRKAFSCMNKTFKNKLNSSGKSITGWRLFQLVFIVSMISEVIRSEYQNDMSIAEADMDVANLLYFPTGGGKTEAFLGITIFAMFFDRLRGKNEGITAFLKYPLRLLAVQQLDRVLTIVMQANAVRESIPALASTTEFRVGFYVGSGNTPNKIDVKERLSSRGKQQKTVDLLLETDQATLVIVV